MPDLSDYFKTFEQLVSQNSFAHECHTVETPDGYQLEVFRIQPAKTAEFGKTGERKFFNKKPVVFL